MKVFVRTLGCPKNTADSSRLLAGLAAYGVRQAGSESEADAIIINTCAFIRSATEESLAEIFSAADRHQRVIVTGCLTGRYGTDLGPKLPEVEAIIPVSEIGRFPEVLFGRKVRPRKSAPDGPLPVLTPASTCYVKISEGCDRRCSFCTIPAIRGPQVSRPVDEIVAEVRRRVDAGVAEVVLVGQDLTAYGRDTGSRLDVLLRRLLRVPGRFVIRLLYLYPAGITQNLADFILGEEKLCNYFDIPFQHSSPKILTSMRRSFDGARLLRLIDRIRRRSPDAAIRATAIVGFPGEGEDEFAELERFVRKAAFDHLGVFRFSTEEGTSAAAMAGQVPERTRGRREHRIMTLQRGISGERLSRFAGRQLDAWVDGPSESGRMTWICRNGFFAPEVDGAIWVRSDRRLVAGERIRVRVTATDDYDLYAEEVR